MKRVINGTVLLLIFVLVVHLHASATTCVANKKFKARQVCGRVSDPTNVPIQGVQVELLDMHSTVLQQAFTDEDGIFNMPNVAKGQYVLRVQNPAFPNAWQPFIVSQKSGDSHCKKPMRVNLGLPGRCSSVSSGETR